jgi:hypothetical protein
MGFKSKLSQYFFSNGITYFFFVILIEIFILKTTMYHKYQGDLHLPGHDTDQRQCAMEWPTTV